MRREEIGAKITGRALLRRQAITIIKRNKLLLKKQQKWVVIYD